MQHRYPLYFALSAIVLAGGFFLRRQHSKSFPQRLTGDVEVNLGNIYRAVESEAAELQQDSVTGKSPKWSAATHFFLRTDSFGIVAWNRSDYVPDAAALRTSGEYLYLSNQRGEFLVRRWPVVGGYLVNVLTLRSRYPIANGFLMASVNERIFPTRDFELTGPAASAGDPVKFNDQVMFRLTPGPAETRDNLASLMTLLAGLALLLLGVNDVRRRVEPIWGYDLTALVLLVLLYGLRQLMVQTQIPSLFLSSDTFDPRVFASSPINATLGDLLINSLCVLVLVVYLFRHYANLRSLRWVLQQGLLLRTVAGIFCLFLSLLAVLFSFNFIEVVYHNSSLTLDISQSVAFSWVRITAFLAAMIGTISAFLFIHVLASWVRHLVPSGWLVFLMALGTAGLLFWLQMELTGNDNRISLFAGLVMLIGMRLFWFEHLEFSFSFSVLLYLIFSLTLFSFHHAMAVRGFYLERQVRDQFRYAKDFLTERDVLGEYLLDKVRQRIAGDPFVQTRMASPFFSKGSVVEKIRRVHMSRYFDRYEVSVKTRGPQDSLGRLPASWQSTGYDGVFYSNAASADALKQYRVIIPVFFQRAVGSVELDLVLKRILPDNVFPELLVDNRFSQLYRNRDFSFAVYRQGEVVNSFGSFHYEKNFDPVLLENQALFEDGISYGGYYHVAVEAAEGSTAVVSSQVYTLASLITNVSFWFVLGLVFVFTIQGIVGLMAMGLGHQFAYTARLQLFMFLAFALPLVAVSVTTLTLMASANEENTTREFVDRSVGMAERLATLLVREEGDEPGRLENWVAEIAASAQADISVYSPAGRLVSTSQPALYENHLISTLMNRDAFLQLVIDGQRQFVSNERIGSLEYSNAYAAVLSPQSGALVAIVSLPFFESASFLQSARARVLSTILQVFVVVFLVFTLLSFLAAESLASPMRFMARTLRQTTLSGTNKPLTWETKDEMGMLVHEYNRMVTNLEESKRALAQSEKESAWREMAKQVAHEIKNPLTPMKLTLQQLEREGDPGVERTKKAVEVMLKQVEILDAIASSFSTLARMPALSPQRTDLVALVRQTAALFENPRDGRVSFAESGEPIWVSVDHTALSRALSNMVINALQARKEGQTAVVDVTVSATNTHALISIRDNGRGIPEDLQNRIFQPQFTTKESGSGLGLYMAHQFVVQSGGKTWFTTSAQGTTFFIELPLIREEPT